MTVGRSVWLHSISKEPIVPVHVDVDCRPNGYILHIHTYGYCSSLVNGYSDVSVCMYVCMYVFYKTPFCICSPFSHDPSIHPSIYSSITQPRISFARASSFPEPRYYSKTRVYFFHPPLRLGTRARPSVTALSKKSNQAKYQRPVLNLGVSTTRWCGAIEQQSSSSSSTVPCPPFLSFSADRFGWGFPSSGRD